MSKEYDSEYLAYLNSMADILSQCDNAHYAWNDPEVMEKRLLQAAPPKAVPAKPQPTQPLTQEKKPNSRPTSNLAWIVMGFDE